MGWGPALHSDVQQSKRSQTLMPPNVLSRNICIYLPHSQCTPRISGLYPVLCGLPQTGSTRQQVRWKEEGLLVSGTRCLRVSSWLGMVALAFSLNTLKAEAGKSIRV